jgi:predicted  nucleic acid-binding Zn-ribbon protein
MPSRGKNGERDGWSDLRPHEEFLELCAVSTTGELSEEEQKRLREHLAICAECRQALTEFEAAAEIGAPLLSSELAAQASNDPEARRHGLAEATITRAQPTSEPAGEDCASLEQRKGLVLGHRNGHHGSHLNWNYVWMSFAAAVLLTVALGIYSYEVGRHRGQTADQAPSSVVDTKADTLEQQISDAGHEREILQAQLAEKDKTIAELRHQVEEQSAALNELRSTETNLTNSLQTDEVEKQKLGQDRSNLSQKLDAAEASIQSTQAQLNSLQQVRSDDQARAASLEAQIKDLNAQLRDREQTIGKQQDLLAHDRDIRDLMGARDLYIAEVYDVARDGATQKPYGRVFYTKGKSLIFYAYDLDQQAGVRNASTFQAWGRRGPDKQQALSLGIFFEDNVAKKRWVLKVDDSKTLEQIDAVFVTVEPNGGSHKPSGKPLLFASLRIEPNHP